MPYIIPHVNDLNRRPPRMLIGHRVLPETNPLRRFEEHKRIVWARDYAYMCLVGIIPAIEPSRGRPDRRLPPAPLPPDLRARRIPRKPLPLGLPAPPSPPGPSPPDPSPPPRPPKDVLRRNPSAVSPLGRPKNPVVPVTTEHSDATWKRVFGRIPPRVLAPIPEDINNITMAPHTTTDEDLCLVPEGSENAVPTVRGIIEEYYEDKEYQQTSAQEKETPLKEKRTPVYLSPEQAQYTAEAIRRSNVNSVNSPSVVRLPPKAKQVLGSPQPVNNNSDWHLSQSVEQSPLHSKGNSVNSLRHSASLKVASLLTPTKTRKPSTSSLAHNKIVKHTSSSSRHTTTSRKYRNTKSSSSPLKHSSILSSINMTAHTSPTKQAAGGAASDKSFTNSPVSPNKPAASPKKEGSSLKRAMSTLLTPGRAREEMPPPPPKKDTPPPANDKPAHLKMSSNIIDVGRPSDAYSGNGFAAAVESTDDENQSIKSRETITVAFGDECSPVKEVKSGVVKMTHQPYSPFVGQKATFEADPKLVKEIDEEFQSPPMDSNLFHSPQIGHKVSPKSAEKAKTPRYIAGGLLEGGLLPPTTYQPPVEIGEQGKPKNEIYSPSMYSVTNGHDVFRSASTPVVPSNSPANDDKQVDGALPHARIPGIRYIKTVQDNDYVYRPEDHVFNRYRGETPVMTHDFAIAGAQQTQTRSANGPATVQTPDHNVNGYNSMPFEYPSAVPPPLRRTSRDNSSRSSSGRSLRDRYKETGGLGIELSESADSYYTHDNGTTMGIDGDDDFERRRQTVIMRSPDFSSKQAGFDGAASQLPMSDENKYKFFIDQSYKELDNAMSSRHDAGMHMMDVLGDKIDRTRNATDHTFTDIRKLRESVAAIATEDRKLRESVDVIAANNYLLRENVDAVVTDTRKIHDSVSDIRGSVAKIRDSVTDMGEHILDNEKLDLLVDKIVERLHPTIVRGIEKNDFNTERILARVEKFHEQMFKEFDYLKYKQGKTVRASPSSSAGHFSPSSQGFFSPSSTGFFSPSSKGHRNPGQYTEEPSER
ncbi:unnamed protein product [Aureobasidium mustum]|uniref:Uncharacterized protein n=1 Tax=Aureobasidium mustum TaxID=2773714 RepID=A0A9N8K4W0_9PEZI|nr:unnamed protein product [Aureobasidium mustum]